MEKSTELNPDLTEQEMVESLSQEMKEMLTFANDTGKRRGRGRPRTRSVVIANSEYDQPKTGRGRSRSQDVDAFYKRQKIIEEPQQVIEVIELSSSEEERVDNVDPSPPSNLVLLQQNANVNGDGTSGFSNSGNDDLATGDRPAEEIPMMAECSESANHESGDSSDDELIAKVCSNQTIMDLTRFAEVEDSDDETMPEATNESDQSVKEESPVRFEISKFKPRINPDWRKDLKVASLPTAKSLNKPVISDNGQPDVVVALEEDDRKGILVDVDPGLAAILKPHQIEGMRFMYRATIVSVKAALSKTSKGSGCILAHSMGLGKTLQVVAFLRAIMTNQKLKTIIQKVLIIVPYNVAQNWVDEFHMWSMRSRRNDSIKLWTMHDAKKMEIRRRLVQEWDCEGGILIITARSFTMLVGENDQGRLKKIARSRIKDPFFQEALCKHSDMVVVDEGHLLKNCQTQMYKAVLNIATKRRIILTGTPLQNNLSEYYWMVDFVKPRLLESYKIFDRRFIVPIVRGQHIDSSEEEVLLMRRRLHILARMVKDHVNRCDYSVLVPYLPRKLEYVLGVRLSPEQAKLYRIFINAISEHSSHFSLLEDSCVLMLLGNHPALMVEHYRKETVGTNHNDWWNEVLTDTNVEALYKPDLSTKILITRYIIDYCQRIGDKLLIFSQSLPTLSLLERMLDQMGWEKMTHWFRIDGAVSVEDRHRMISTFNDPDNVNARIFLISTKAGCLGINLIGANRCILMDCSWNPANDDQAIFRIFRLGQPKPVYIYRLVAYGTMEWKIYERQVLKQSLAKRVVDEQQIVRQFTSTELAHLYIFDENPPMMSVPKGQLLLDNLLVDLLQKHRDQMVSCHTHDSLLKERPDEELDDVQKIDAWNEFIKKNEKMEETEFVRPSPTNGIPDVKPPPPSPAIVVLPNGYPVVQPNINLLNGFILGSPLMVNVAPLLTQDGSSASLPPPEVQPLVPNNDIPH